ncbi:hypothetical protein Atai01_60940 [Amycolatopsis taiwanensis]|uniref:Uncharacterized protein n=1 Tax=Amycolatopsis taiwanensis TaxID=342230 RepID=A0A9W6R8N6_9PSEU|nr:hypothetical protein Atai01_60940 [Amycolatopsis taiwanensis]
MQGRGSGDGKEFEIDRTHGADATAPVPGFGASGETLAGVTVVTKPVPEGHAGIWPG